MTNREKEMLKGSYQQRFLRLQGIKKFAEQGKKGWSKEDYEKQSYLVAGYKIAVLELLELNKRTGTCDHIIAQWEKEIIEWNEQVQKEHMAAN